MIFNDFKMRLDQEECLQHQQFVYENKAPSHATIFRWFTEFHRGRNSLLNEKHTGKPLSAAISENMWAIQKMLIDDNRCIYQMMLKELNI